MNDIALRKAFEETDFICRRFAAPTVRQSLLRALALLALGDRENCRRDLAYALEGPSDPDVLDVCLRLGADVGLAKAAFSLFSIGDDLLHRAASIALQNEKVLLRAERTQEGLNALMACRTGAAPTLFVDGGIVDLSDMTTREVGEMAFFHLRRRLPHSAGSRIAAFVGQHRSAITLPPRSMPCIRGRLRPGVVSVVVPIYGGREVTLSCLVALSRQTCRHEIEVVIVDDACPDDTLAADVAAIAAEQGWRYLRNESNLGFAASVNRGAAITEGSNILLLNADALLPPGAIDRLLAATSDETVGTVVPLSNDGGLTSFPIMRKVNPLPSDGEASRIDAAAQCVAVPGFIEIPSGTGFCMLVTGRCWDALSGLDLGYGRGYFEDVDLCLRASRIGFRNVLVPTLYVRHVGGQSFQTLKKALVAENARLICERFPDYDPAWMAFVEGDPLAALRSKIERRLPSLAPVHVVAGRGASSLDLSALIGCVAATQPGRWLVLQEDREGGLRLRDPDNGVPQTLRFGPDERDDLAAYLHSLTMASLSLVDPSEALLRDLDAVVPDTVPVTVPVTGPRSLDLLKFSSGLLRRAHPEALDGMSRAALGHHVDPLPPPRCVDTVPSRLAALVPRPSIRVERMLSALDRRLRTCNSEVVVFGETFSIPTQLLATGKMATSEYADALRHRGITHVLLPDVDSPFQLVEHLRRTSPLPAAYVDWAPGRHRAAPGDLAIRIDDTEAEQVSAIVGWCLGESCHHVPSTSSSAAGARVAATPLTVNRAEISNTLTFNLSTSTSDRPLP